VTIVAHYDAGKRGKGSVGPSACGAIVCFEDEIVERTEFLGETTVNAAEWSGLLLTLRIVLEHDADEELQIFSDSLLVVMQALGKWRVKEPRLVPYRSEARRLASMIKDRGCIVKICHVPREMNGVADALVRKILDEHVRQYRKR
jgi:ribonuclease HI